MHCSPPLVCLGFSASGFMVALEWLLVVSMFAAVRFGSSDDQTLVDLAE
jgi:hypothetical protein